MSESLRATIEKHLLASPSRFELWQNFIDLLRIQRMAEVGVLRGDFASHILAKCKCLDRYYMIDPWRHLDNWNKPANADNQVFEQHFLAAKASTDFAHEKRTILRGTTTEVIGQVDDGELDLVYIDADHTLRGITIDLVLWYPKLRNGGFIGGDDFTTTIWQHGANFEPTMVFPFAVYFAEAVGATIYALPHSQFLMHKTGERSFVFVDLTGQYGNQNVRDQLRSRDS